MIRIFPILMHEKLRRIKKTVTEKPIFVLVVVFSVISMIYTVIKEPMDTYNISDILGNQIVVLGGMTYLVAKIINPTQEMVVDYQLIELKLISLWEYKLLIGLKLLGGSLLLSLLCLNFYTETVAIFCALNVAVNVWIFLRNRWNSRVYDFVIAIIVILGIKHQLLYLSLLCTIILILVFVLLRRINYESILSLYKLIYQIGQQRFGGAYYNETESRDIQVSAETLVGKAKERNSDWCERFYDNERKFIAHKELARIMANSGKYIAYLIISILIGVAGFYLPKEYIIFGFMLLVGIAFSFDMLMNKSEANLLLRGYVNPYVALDIIKGKFFTYTVVNLILILPAIFWGWKLLILVVVSACLTTVLSLGKCFIIRRNSVA